MLNNLEQHTNLFNSELDIELSHNSVQLVRLTPSSSDTHYHADYYTDVKTYSLNQHLNFNPLFTAFEKYDCFNY